MHRRGAKTKIVILDAGRRNPFERRFRQTAEGLAPLDAPEGTLAMYSAALNRVMSDGTAAGNSAFVNELMKEIRVPNVTAEEVFNRVRVGVSRATSNEQIPWVASSLVQDFYFGTPPVAPRPQPAPAPSEARPTPAPLPPVVLPSAAPATTTGAQSAQLAFGGWDRTYQLVRPSEQGPRPTIIMLHGLGGTGAEIAKRSGLDQSAPRAGFVGVFPDGLRNRWNSFPPGTEPALYVERNRREVGGVPDDVAFLKALVADLVRRGISDPKRIYLAGVSNGEFMTLRMICADAGLLAAAAVLVSGMLDPTGAECRPAKPVPVLMAHGTADPIVPFAGGAVQPGPFANVWSAERLTGFLRERNGCTDSADVSDPPNAGRNRVVLFRWTRCSGAPVDSYRVMGGDHGSAWAINNLGQVLLDFFRDKVRDDAVATTTPSADGPAPLGYAARPNQRPVAAAGVPTSVAYRRYEGTNLITGAMTRTGGDAWVETNSRGSKWSFRATLETSSEVTLYDASRDVHVKLDLIEKKMLMRRGTAPWSPLADITGVEK
jgi:poly(3-hydroxybutyrate) depolymerase